MRAIHIIINALQLLGPSLAATIPATPSLTLYDSADDNLTFPPNSTLFLHVNSPSGVSVPPPAAPYYTTEGAASLKFYDYGAALPPAPVRELIETALTDIVVSHNANREIGKEIVYSEDLDAGAGTLWLTVEPEAGMIWGMFADAVAGAMKFLRRWDNVEFAVDVEMRVQAGVKVGTVFLSHF